MQEEKKYITTTKILISCLGDSKIFSPSQAYSWLTKHLGYDIEDEWMKAFPPDAKFENMGTIETEELLVEAIIIKEVADNYCDCGENWHPGFICSGNHEIETTTAIAVTFDLREEYSKY